MPSGNPHGARKECEGVYYEAALWQRHPPSVLSRRIPDGSGVFAFCKYLPASPWDLHWTVYIGGDGMAHSASNVLVCGAVADISSCAKKAAAAVLIQGG